MEDFDEEDFICPECGHEGTRSLTCTNWCDDGWHDESEENFSLPGTDLVMCEKCNGTGLERWCPRCGANLSGRRDLEDPNEEND